MAVSDTHVFPDFLTPALTELFFPKPTTTFVTCFCRVERQKYSGKKVHLNRGSNSQPPGYETDILTTEPPGRGHWKGISHARTKEALVYLHHMLYKESDHLVMDP